MRNKYLFYIFTALFLITKPAFCSEDSLSLEDKEYKVTIDKISQNNFANISILQGLNKITAKTSEFEINVGEEMKFGKLTIKVHKCWQAPLDQRPESKILLEIYETTVNNIEDKIFYGWMFASSPSLSGLEHPIYDITALGCKFR